MDTKKLLELTQRYQDIEQQIDSLVSEKEQIETAIERVALGKSEATRAPSRRKKRSSKKRSSKKRSGKKRTRKSKAGDEITAFEELCLEFFEKNPNKEISCADLYDHVGAPSKLDQSRVRAAVTRLKKRRRISKVKQGVYVHVPKDASDDESAILRAMTPGKPMQTREIIDAINPPNGRKHALQNRVWMMYRAGKLRRLSKGTYMLPAR